MKLGTPGGNGHSERYHVPLNVLTKSRATSDGSRLFPTPFLLICTLSLITTLSCTSNTSGNPESDDSELVTLTPFTELTPVDAEDDPLARHRPIDVACNNLGGWYLEDGFVEVDTGHCNYLSLSEPAAVSASKGSILRSEISFFDLTADEPATAHLALVLGNTTVWEDELSIPGKAQVIEITAELPFDVQQGDPVILHLHNHGQNTYKFGKVFVSPPNLH
jgi:hypothetical protein